jgi:hypothetical protein
MKPLCVVAVLSLLLAGLAAVLEFMGHETDGGAYACAALSCVVSSVGLFVLAHQANEHNHAEAMLTLKTELDLASRGEES